MAVTAGVSAFGPNTGDTITRAATSPTQPTTPAILAPIPTPTAPAGPFDREAEAVAHPQLLEAMRVHLPDDITTIEAEPGLRLMSYLAIRSDGRMITISFNVGRQHAPGSEPTALCDVDTGVDQQTGVPNPRWTDCVRGTLPDGSKTLGASITSRGTSMVKLVIVTQDGVERWIDSSAPAPRVPGRPEGPPLTAAQLSALASEPVVFTALTRVPPFAV